MCGKMDISERKRAKKQAGHTARYSRRETDTLEPLPLPRDPPYAEAYLVAGF